MCNPTPKQRDHLDLIDSLTQHLTQAEAVIDYMTVDVGENKDFSVSNEVVANMLWTAQTLITNAKKVANELAEVSRAIHHSSERGSNA